MTGCRAPMLQVPVSFRLVLLSFLVAGGCVPMAGAGILLAGVVVLPGGWCMCPCGWWRLLTSSPAYSQPGTLAGTHVTPQCGGARRRNPSFKGIKMKGYCSIYQLFKLSSWVALYKSFMNRNLIKTLFSIDYRGYFIIQATHSTINYSHFLHKTDRNTWKTNKIVQNHHKTNEKLLIIWFIRYKYISLHH